MLDKQILGIPVQYGHSISIHVMENSQLSAWLNKCLFPLPTLPAFFSKFHVEMTRTTHMWLKQCS